MKALFDKVSAMTSKLTTRAYSTSFSHGTRFLGKEVQDPIYAIYGFVRLADEIVDSFHDYNKAKLLERYRKETYQAIDEGISLNPILNSFQKAVHDFDIDRELIDTFLDSMEMDLSKTSYSRNGYDQYILGSAEVVGLMCLKVFVKGDKALYDELQASAMRLGSAFQKINFLRDLKADFLEMGRTYFPGLNLEQFNQEEKKRIEQEIEADFKTGYAGILKLPKNARFGVYMAYIYFYQLFKKIEQTSPDKIMSARIRIPNNQKYALFVESYFKHSLDLL